MIVRKWISDALRARRAWRKKWLEMRETMLEPPYSVLGEWLWRRKYTACWGRLPEVGDWVVILGARPADRGEWRNVGFVYKVLERRDGPFGPTIDTRGGQWYLGIERGVVPDWRIVERRKRGRALLR